MGHVKVNCVPEKENLGTAAITAVNTENLLAIYGQQKAETAFLVLPAETIHVFTEGSIHNLAHRLKPSSFQGPVNCRSADKIYDDFLSPRFIATGCKEEDGSLLLYVSREAMSGVKIVERTPGSGFFMRTSPREHNSKVYRLVVELACDFATACIQLDI